MIRLLLLSFALIFIFLPVNTFAVEETIPIRLMIGDDTIPPTTPLILTVVPDAPSQITVTWGASTDNVSLSGYRVYRDGFVVATTTSTSFIDTGLTASTTYEYMVDAFDWLFNVSTTSNPVATTTLSLVEETTATSSSGGSLVNPEILKETKVGIETELNSAKLRWKTNLNTRYILKYGRTLALELGSVQSNIFSNSHQTIINNLEPNTRYWYEIIAIHPLGIQSVIAKGDFMTKTPTVLVTPANVTNFTAKPTRDYDVRLDWEVSLQNSFVRILRSPLFYPEHFYDGTLVYEGTAKNFLDKGALREFSPAFYTIFVVSESGLISSGAVARVERLKSVDYQNIDTDSARDEENVEVEGDILIRPLPPIITVPYEQVTPDNILLEQGIRSLNLSEATSVGLYLERATLVSLSADLLPNNLKTILVTVANPTNNKQTTTYLLKINNDGDRYEAVLPAMTVAGSGYMMVEIYDYQKQVVRRLSNLVKYIGESQNTKVALYSGLVVFGAWVIWLLFLFIWRRRK